MKPKSLIALVCAAEVAGMAAYAGFVAQLPLLSAAWGLTASRAGWVSGAFYAGYALAVPILVTLTDRTDPLRVYLPSMLATALGALGFALLVDGFWSALLFQALMGAGLAGTYMPGLRLLTDRLEGAVQSRAVAFYTSSYAIGTGLSFALIGFLSALLGWRWAFGLAAIGPVAAFAVVGMLFHEQTRRQAADARAPGRLEFGAALRDRAVLTRAVAYGAHNFELFGLWSWAVAFLTFAYTLRPGDPFQIEPTLVAALLTLLLLPASVGGNELALRIGRRRWIVGVMIGSAVLAPVVGFAAGAVASAALIALCLVYGLAVAAESGALTSSVVAIGDSRQRGAIMAVYSTVGFAGAFAGPLVFGWVLGGVGAETVTGWGAAFAAMGLGALAGPAALLLLDRRRSDPQRITHKPLPPTQPKGAVE
jgi:MFS family permease